MSPLKISRPKLKWPIFTLDLRKPLDRWKLVLIGIGWLALGVVILVTGIHAYTYTESPAFCGTVCHPMEPQRTRYLASAHSNVACTECHVGPGFQAFVHSKISGLRQLIGVVTNNYDRPIKSPVKDLRPARETCETCHTPTTFKDNIVKIVQHYDSDPQNTPVEITYILKLGGYNQATGESNGIHWHISSEVYYIATDPQRQQIAWVGIKQPDGSMKQYFQQDLLGMGQTAFVQQAQKNNQVRRMDCIDCHNRTAHYIPYPEQAVDNAISNNLISRDLPSIRAKAVELLKGSYASEDDALVAINQIKDYYEPMVGTDGITEDDVTQAAATLKDLYTTTDFPEMNLDWKTNPNNQQHTPTLGCFRCHDDKHVYVDAQGNQQTISAQCNLCHTVPIVGRGSDILVEAPVIVGNAPASHKDFSWTLTHRNITDAEKQDCLNCHGQSFCNNAVCHNLSHPADMLTSHAQEIQKQGGQVCYTCHQDIFCARCHETGVVNNP